MDSDASGEVDPQPRYLFPCLRDEWDLNDSELKEDDRSDHLDGMDFVTPRSKIIPYYSAGTSSSGDDSIETIATLTEIEYEYDGSTGGEPMGIPIYYSSGSNSSWTDFESSDGMLFMRAGRYQCTSGDNIDHILSGRWIDPKLITIEPLDICSEIVASANLALRITDLSRDIFRKRRRRFFNENEYVRLNEHLISDIFVILFCFRVTELSNGTNETPTSQFFVRKWIEVVRDLMENFNSKAYSRETFEAEYGLQWTEDKSYESDDFYDF